MLVVLVMTKSSEERHMSLYFDNLSDMLSLSGNSTMGTS